MSASHALHGRSPRGRSAKAPPASDACSRPPAFLSYPSRGLPPRAPLKPYPIPSCGACPGRAKPLYALLAARAGCRGTPGPLAAACRAGGGAKCRLKFLLCCGAETAGFPVYIRRIICLLLHWFTISLFCSLDASPARQPNTGPVPTADGPRPGRGLSVGGTHTTLSAANIALPGRQRDVAGCGHFGEQEPGGAITGGTAHGNRQVLRDLEAFCRL
jgi:hypothetical protein